MSLNSSHILIFQINLQLVKFLSQSCTVEAPSRTSHLISLKMFLNLKIRGTKRLREYVYEQQTVKKRKTETEKEEKICEKKTKKNRQEFFSKNYLFYYKRLFRFFTGKKINEQQQLKQISFDPNFEKTYTHCEIVNNNIKMYKEQKKRKKNEERNKESERKDIIENLEKRKEGKIEKTKNSIEKKKESERKDIHINFGKNEEEKDHEEEFKITYEETKKELEKRKLSRSRKIKGKNECPFCCKCFVPKSIKRHIRKHFDTFIHFHINLSSSQIETIIKENKNFTFFDQDKYSKLLQKEKNLKITECDQEAKSKNKPICFLSRFKKQMSLQSTRPKFWTFESKLLGCSKKNFFKRKTFNQDQKIKIKKLFLKNDNFKNADVLFNILKLTLKERIKLFLVFEAIKKVGDFTFVNFSVNTKQHFLSNNRAKRNVKILPNCLKIEIEKFNYILNYFKELEIINFEQDLMIENRKRNNGIFSSVYYYFDLQDIERLNDQFAIVHNIDSINNTINTINHFDIMRSLFEQFCKKFGSDFYGSSSSCAKAFYGSRVNYIHSSTLSYLFKDFIKYNEIKADSSIINSTSDFIEKKYITQDIKTFNNKIEKLIKKEVVFKNVKLRKSKECVKEEIFDKHKTLMRNKEWTRLVEEFDRKHPNNTSRENAINFIKANIKFLDLEEKYTCKIDYDSLVAQNRKLIKKHNVEKSICKSKINKMQNLPNFSNFIVNNHTEIDKLIYESFKEKIEHQIIFNNAQKLDNDTFFEFACKLYKLLEHSEKNLHDQVNDSMISHLSFCKIYSSIESSFERDIFYFISKKCNNIMDACIRFDKYLKTIQVDDHLITLS